MTLWKQEYNVPLIQGPVYSSDWPLYSGDRCPYKRRRHTHAHTLTRTRGECHVKTEAETG